MAHQARPGTVIGGRYSLTRLLGVGGFGQVWQAHDTLLGVDVAVKQVRLDVPLPDEARAELLARAAREARHAARLRDHPHIVTVHDVVEVDEGHWKVPWIVMQWVDGCSLAEELKERGPLNQRRTRETAEALLGALDAAHRAGVVHRDVKPGNVLLAADGSVLLADFGIALASTDPRLTRTTLVIGSPGYMAPERWQGAESDGRADLFSLGVTLYEAVEGVLPFRSDNPTAVLTEPPRPPERAGTLAPLLTLLLDKDPARRPTVSEARTLLGARTPGTTRPTVRETERQMPPGEGAAVTLTNTRGTMMRTSTDRWGMPSLFGGLVLGIVLGAITFGEPVVSFGDVVIKGDSRFGNALAGGFFLAILGAAFGLLIGAAVGARTRSDSITVDARGITVTAGKPTTQPRRDQDGTLRPGGPSAFTIRFDAVERVAVERRTPMVRDHSALAVWFRPANEPTAAWRARHGVTEREGGGLWVYEAPAKRPAAVDPERLRDPLRRFAARLYDDPDHVPDP
ncbi:serine/threonine-protein kinase [Streptomyces sp. SP2-10]|uniref:serine/threonine-protein kinase n=1 Tax=Streptomyces sp. SP2-10 TaxID=2873385 RepID=UPI001CA6FF43|nr:serine/threonine-protein kinase [Streptomyces sp. SP2-10]MBY8845797.1 serine/threonine protein kinase [Streptomyces sp. SP2-10]